MVSQKINYLFIFGYDNFFNFLHVQDLIRAVDLCIEKIFIIKKQNLYYF